MVFLAGPKDGLDLYFLRHAIAAERGDPKYKDDRLRPLTAQGREKMRRGAQGMKTLGLKFGAIISSPYLRARQTAEIVSQVYKLKLKSIYFTDNLLPPASIEKLLKEMRSKFPGPKSFLLVGHEPHLTDMISSLLKNGRTLDIDLKKGGLCCLRIQQSSETTSANLKWLLTATQLGLLSKE